MLLQCQLTILIFNYLFTFGLWEFPFPLWAQLSISRDVYFYPAFVGILFKKTFLKFYSLSHYKQLHLHNLHSKQSYLHNWAPQKKRIPAHSLCSCLGFEPHVLIVLVQTSSCLLVTNLDLKKRNIPGLVKGMGGHWDIEGAEWEKAEE